MREASAVDDAAALLGLRIVRRFDASMFGAALVEGRGDEPLVLKASVDRALAPEWSTGVAMASRLRALGYPASNYVDTGTTDHLVWSLQHVLPGRVPDLFTAAHATQLIALARRHDIDSGMRQPWDALAREESRRALTQLGSLPDRFDVTRKPNDHVTFGPGGPHFCLGAHLARLEATILFEELLPRIASIELAGPPERIRSNFVNGIKRMPVRIVAR